MNKFIILVCFILCIGHHVVAQKIIARQGRVAFFSYTPVENIKAENNQVLSIIDLSNGSIAVSMLMNAFIFEKALMREHFNESYVESDLYPKATFVGEILDFDPLLRGEQTRIIKGNFTMHDVSTALEIKTKIDYIDNSYEVSGSFEAMVKDYEIKIPPLLAGNIAKVITVDFRFEYEPYQE